MSEEIVDTTHDRIDATIADIAATLADPESDKTVPVERDMAIIMACCAVTKSEMPESKEGNAQISKQLMRDWLQEIASVALELGGVNQTHTVDIMIALGELAYEFDEDLAKEFNDSRKKIENGEVEATLRPLAEERVEGPIEPKQPSAPSASGVSIPPAVVEDAVEEVEEGEEFGKVVNLDSITEGEVEADDD
jgi:hypothetical protein